MVEHQDNDMGSGRPKNFLTMAFLGLPFQKSNSYIRDEYLEAWHDEGNFSLKETLS